MRCLVLLTVAASACAAPGSTTSPVFNGPGAITGLGGTLAIAFTPSQVAQGTDAQFTITLPAKAYNGGLPLIFTFSGEATGADTLTLPPDSAGLPIPGDIQVPASAPDGVLNVMITLPTLGDSAAATLTIKDTQAPTVSVSGLTANVYGFNAGSLLLAGATDTVVVDATDNHALAWVGWTSNTPALPGDSAPASGVASTVSFPIQVPSSLGGDSVAISVFATDSDGNVVTVSQPNWFVSRVTTHPVQSVPRGARVGDIAFDSARGVVYLAKPDSQIVTVLALNGLAYQAPIAVGGAPVAVDLSPGGDSLIVGLASPASVAVVSLTSASHPVIGTLAFGSSDSLSSLRVTADGKVLAYVKHDAVELDLATGATQAVAASTGGCLAHVTRSGDRTRALMLNCPTVMYSSVTQRYVGGPPLGSGGGVNVFTSANATGSMVYQVQHVLIDSTITPVLSGGQDAAYGAAVAPNGVDFYVGEGACTIARAGTTCPDSLPGLYLHYVRPTASPIEISVVPHPAYELAVDPSGTTLIGLTADTIFAVDLTRATNIQTARGTPSRRAKRARATARCAQPGAFELRLQLKLQLQLPGTMRCVNKST